MAACTNNQDRWSCYHYRTAEIYIKNFGFSQQPGISFPTKTAATPRERKFSSQTLAPESGCCLHACISVQPKPAIAKLIKHCLELIHREGMSAPNGPEAPSRKPRHNVNAKLTGTNKRHRRKFVCIYYPTGNANASVSDQGKWGRSVRLNREGIRENRQRLSPKSCENTHE